MHQILLPSHPATQPIQHDQIVRIQASSNYSKIILTSGKSIVVSKVLQWFEQQLPEKMFIRVHRSHLVNQLHVQRRDGSNNNVLLLANGDTIVMSRRKKVNLNILTVLILAFCLQGSYSQAQTHNVNPGGHHASLNASVSACNSMTVPPPVVLWPVSNEHTTCSSFSTNKQAACSIR